MDRYAVGHVIGSIGPVVAQRSSRAVLGICDTHRVTVPPRERHAAAAA